MIPSEILDRILNVGDLSFEEYLYGEFIKDTKQWKKEMEDFSGEYTRKHFFKARPIRQATRAYTRELDTYIGNLRDLERGHSKKGNRAKIQDWFERVRRNDLGAT